MNTLHSSTKERKPMVLTEGHVVNGTRLYPPFPDGLETAYFGMGCFWGAECIFWLQKGVYTTAVGFAGGSVAHATYRDVCSGRTDHAEVVMVVYDPKLVSYEDLLTVFWKKRRPGVMKRDAVFSDQYRSAIFSTTSEQAKVAVASVLRYQQGLELGEDEQAAVEVSAAPPIYYAEQYHQQYQARR